MINVTIDGSYYDASHQIEISDILNPVMTRVTESLSFLINALILSLSFDWHDDMNKVECNDKINTSNSQQSLLNQTGISKVLLVTDAFPIYYRSFWSGCECGVFIGS